MQPVEHYRMPNVTFDESGLDEMTRSFNVILDKISLRLSDMEGREGKDIQLAGDLDLDGKRIRNVGQSQGNLDAVSREEALNLANQELRKARIVLSREATAAATIAHSVTGGDTVSQSGVETALDNLGTSLNEIISILA